MPQILALIQVFANTEKKHDDNNLTFEVHAKNNLKIIYPK
jgi:hypothetical protein